MKKSLLIFYLFLLLGFSNFAQTTATDFNVNDCSGVSKHLFTELDAGKIIVLAMVDPCASCVNPAKNALSVVKSYATSNPGKVIYYLVDDYGNTTCSQLSSWGTSYGITGVVTISDALVNQGQYGGAAMPKIVVVGGSNHTVYFKQDNGLNTANLTNAINQAITASGNDELGADFQLSLYPNPSTDKIFVSYFLKNNTSLSFEIYNMLGSKVKTMLQDNFVFGKHESVFDLVGLSNGIYFLKINSGTTSQNIRFTISK